MPRLAALLLLTATLLQAATAPAGAVAVARSLPGLIGCAGNYCHLVERDGSRRRVVIDRLPPEVQRRLMLECPVTRGCQVRLTAIADPFGALWARGVVLLDA